MRHDKLYLKLLILSILFFSCDSSIISPANNNGIYGAWVEKSGDNGIRILERSNDLHKDKYGFIIHSAGTFTERKNSGWCGTPPISYANFEGIWKFEYDDLINIEVDYWGGRTNYKFKILLVNKDELRVKIIYDN